jgi:hypothetical protein
MSGFEFFFSFYGLILGLAMAELLSGFATVARIGRLRDLGWGTTLLGLEVAYEILIFWLAAWHQYRDVEPSIRTLALPFVSGAIYFIAAGIVFPREPKQIDDLDGYFMAHKRKVATCLLIIFTAGVINEVRYAVAAAEQGRWAYLFGYYVPFNLSMFAGYLVLIFSPSRRWSIAALCGMLGWFVYVTVVRGY